MALWPYNNIISFDFILIYKLQLINVHLVFQFSVHNNLTKHWHSPGVWAINDCQTYKFKTNIRKPRNYYSHWTTGTGGYTFSTSRVGIHHSFANLAGEPLFWLGLSRMKRGDGSFILILLAWMGIIPIHQPFSSILNLLWQLLSTNTTITATNSWTSKQTFRLSACCLGWVGREAPQRSSTNHTHHLYSRLLVYANKYVRCHPHEWTDCDMLSWSSIVLLDVF